MRLLKRDAKQAGDTIVEVLIVLAILALAFAISYATANRGTQEARNAEEHSEALQFVDSQVELLRLAAADDTAKSQITDITNFPSFCLSTNATGAPVLTRENRITASPINAGQVDTSQYASGCQQGNYYESVTYEGPTASLVPTGNDYDNFFAISIYWNGIGTLGVQHEELNYRIYGGI